MFAKIYRGDFSGYRSCYLCIFGCVLVGFNLCGKLFKLFFLVFTGELVCGGGLVFRRLCYFQSCFKAVDGIFLFLNLIRQSLGCEVGCGVGKLLFEVVKLLILLLDGIFEGAFLVFVGFKNERILVYGILCGILLDEGFVFCLSVGILCFKLGKLSGRFVVILLSGREVVVNGIVEYVVYFRSLWS